MKKIGILGGTFDPIHNGHIRMAITAKVQYDLDEVCFIPSNHPPHKQDQNIVSNEHRTRMIKKAIEDFTEFTFDDIELNREGLTYTKDTLKYLTKKNPDVEYFFIIGSDSLDDFDTWKNPEEIVKYATILVASRDEVFYDELKEKCKAYSDKYNAKFKAIKFSNLNISSKDIRKRLDKNQLITGLCPKKVVDYIYFNCLYGFEIRKMTEELNEARIIDYLRATLKPKRFYHTLGVAYTAGTLACFFDEDPKKAKLAGLLHDCAKYYSDKEMLSKTAKHVIDINFFEQNNPALIHAKLGEYYAKTKYGIKDKDILAAVRNHTTGRENMSLLEKIIYVADYIEPSRDMKCKPYSLKKIRKIAYRDIDKAVLLIMENTMTYLKKSNSVIDDTTLEAYKYYKKHKGE